MRNFLFAFFLFFLINNALGQTLKGQVKSFELNQPISFVNISVGNKVVAVTDIEGLFECRLSSFLSSAELKFSHLGYETVKLVISEIDTEEDLEIILKKKNVLLPELMVGGANNEADEIVKVLIEKTKDKGKYGVDNFSYNAYHKVVVYPDFQDSIAFKSLQNTFDSVHLFISETLSERKYIRGKKDQELLLDQRISGFQNEEIVKLATFFQPISIYNSVIEIFDNQFINPIYKGGNNYYDYDLTDKLLSVEGDTIFIISFFPKNPENASLLQGMFYLQSNDFQVRYFKAGPLAFTEGNNLLIQQEFCEKDGMWFPETMSVKIVYDKYPSDQLKLVIEGKSYLSNIEINKKSNEIVDNKVFDSLDWNSSRASFFQPIDSMTYKFADSLYLKKGIKAIGKTLHATQTNSYSMGRIDLDFDQIVNYNHYEALRLGISIRSNHRFSKLFNWHLYSAIGTKDQGLKYGAGLEVLLSTKHDLSLEVKYKNDVEEPANAYGEGVNYSMFKPRYLRYLMINRMDAVQEFVSSFKWGITNKTAIELGGNHRQVNPTYSYNYNLEENFIVDEIFGEFKVYPDKTLIKGDKRIRVGYKTLPIVKISYQKGFEAMNGGVFYDRISMAFGKDYYFRKLGVGRVLINSGYVSDNVPYFLLFQVAGSKNNNWLQNFYLKESFQTVGIYEYVNQRFVNVFLEQEIARRVWSSWSSPIFSFQQVSAFGNNVNAQYHHGVDIQGTPNGLHEVGFKIDQLISLNTDKIFNFSFGLGAFHRYGTYAKTGVWQNTALKFSLGASL